jgi:GNAT superfamily N-acetyltransferase
MARRIVPLTADRRSGLPTPCAQCPTWQLSSWVEPTSERWGPCGRVALVDDEVAGFLLYAPPGYVPRATAFATAPVSPDAVLLLTGKVLPEHEGTGLGKALVQAMAKDLVTRGVKAVEAYGSEPARDCLLPTAFLLALGFAPVREHARNPRLRLDLRTALSWREDVEGVWGRVRGAVRPFPAGQHPTSVGTGP